MTEHLSDLELDALRRASAERGRAHLSSCEACQARQTTLAEEDAVFDARFVPAQLAVQARAAAERRRWRWPALGAAFATAAALFVAVPSKQIRTKGGAEPVAVFVRAEGQSAALSGPVDPEARLRVQVRGPGYGRVLWGSASGAWRGLYPTPDAEPWRVEAATWLPREIELDGAPETERLGVVVCPAPFDEARAKAILRSGAADECRHGQVTIEKR